MLAAHLTALETHLAGGLRADAQAAGLLEATARVLLALGVDEAIPMRALAARIGRDATTATRFVNRAERDGLLARAAGTRDRRRRLASLTEAGREARARLVVVRERRAAALLERLLGATGLHEGQVEWFLAALLEGMHDDGMPHDEGADAEDAASDAP